MTGVCKRFTVKAVRARFRLDPLSFDWLLAVLLTAASLLGIWFGNGADHRVLGALVATGVCATVGVRRLYPMAAGLAAQSLMTLAHAWGILQAGGWTVGWFCALYGLTVWTTRRRFATGLVFVAFTDVLPWSPGSLDKGIPFMVGTVVVMVLVRRVVGDRERRAELAERERDLVAREAVVDERARIARELHDAVAHNVSMIVIQAGAERRVLDGQSGSTYEVLQTIEHIGRGALTEMRRLVGMLRSDSADPLAPQPGLADLSTLVRQISDAGLPVALRIDGERRALPVGIELSAYRIVQEALTNALKHAGEAHASVRVRYGPDSLELEIVDDGAGSPALAGSGGHGLVGMRERVALYGGRLDAGRRPSGGFVVSVLLPIR